LQAACKTKPLLLSDESLVKLLSSKTKPLLLSDESLVKLLSSKTKPLLLSDAYLMETCWKLAGKNMIECIIHTF